MKKFLILSLTILSLISIPLIIQEVVAENSVTKIIKLTGSLIGTEEDEDFLLPESLTNLNKTITFMSVRHLGDGNAKEIYRSWDFINNTAIRFHGSSNFPSNNAPMDFVAYFVEFTAGSDMIVQNGTLIVDGGDVNQEFIATLSPSVNATNSFYTFDGLNMDHADLSWGSEEFGIMRVKNDTSWGYEPADAPNSGNTEVRFSVIDWNNSNFIIQNGTGSLQDLDLIDTIVPSPAIDRRHTIVLISTSFDGELDATSDEYGVTGRINSSNEVEIEREDADCGGGSNCIVNYRWELITFPTTFANVTHDQIFKSGETGSDVTVSTIDIFSPALGNASKAIAIGTNHNPMGLGQARDSSGSSGTWDRNAYTIELINATAVNGTANDARNSATVPYQVIEFLLVSAGQTFNQTEIDVVSAVDVGTQFDVTKLFSDTATVLDQVQTDVVTDQLENDTATVTDQTNLNITKEFLDTTTVLDTVSSNVTTLNNVLLDDTATVTDQVRFIINKTAVDISTAVDQGTGFNVTKIFADIVLTVDGVNTNVATNFNTTATDTATILDIIELGITKAIQDNVIVLDGVDTSTITQITITDIVQVQDNNLGIIITPILPPSGGGGSGGGGGTPDPEGFQRIIGLDIQSEVIEVQLSTVVPSDFEITVFGQQTTGIFITGLVTEPQFVSWFNFGEEPRELDFDVTIDQQKTSNDPTRIQNLALDDFVVNAPNIPCTLLDPFDPPQACLDPILYEVPVEFEFSKGGVTFHEDHIIIVDARVLEKSCIIFGLEYPLILCENISITTFSVVDGGTENSIPILILPVLLLALLTFIVFAFRQAGKGGIRSTTRRKFRKRDELTSMSDRQVRRKFKRGR
ncbi:MAG: hypothetical protein KJI69_05595 [Patescibacteria group bacterium]|nr:hypothetical protein [Patescibacteria group bacterium]